MKALRRVAQVGLSGLLIGLAMSATAVAETRNCGAEWTKLADSAARILGTSTPAPGLFRQTADGGCVTRGLVFPVNQHLTVKASELRWTGRDMARFATEGLPPTSLNVTLSGIRVVPQVGDKTFQYLQDIQSRGQTIDISLGARWDEAEKAVEIDEVLITLPAEDFIRFEARIEGVDLSTANSVQMSVGSLGLTEARLQIRSTRMFQNYLLLPLGMALLDGHPDPEARTGELIAEGKEIIDQSPSVLVSQSSKAALKSLLDDLPDPAGLLTYEMTATPGLGVARALLFERQGHAIRNVEDLGKLLDGIDVEITYERF